MVHRASSASVADEYQRLLQKGANGVMYEKIPQELKQLKQWVCWSGDKLPKNPYTGGNAQSNNPDTWGDFNTACSAVAKYHFNGIGFMFAPPYFGVDMDDCMDNQDLVDEFVESLGSYTEISTSGTGIHIICKGVLPDGARRKGKIEMYSERRYFIMTGRVYDEKYLTIADCTEKIKVLHHKYLYTPTPKALPRAFEKLDMSDQEIIDKARNCKTGSLFQLLYAGSWEGLYPSQSEADLALCNQLAFWTQKNERQMDAIFRSSGLMRPKWDRKRGALTYGQITVQKACLACTEVYEPKPTLDDTKIAIGMFRGDKFGRQDQPRNNYDMTDSGNAQRLKDKFSGSIRYSYTRKKWMYWTGKHWCYDETGEIKKLADLIIEDLKTEAFRCEDDEEREKKLKFAYKTAGSAAKVNMIKETEHLDGVPVLIDELDAYTDYLNVQNGIVNLRNGELLPHDSKFMMSKICACDYDNIGEHKPERWLKFLDDVCDGDNDLVRYLQKSVGYSLTGSIREQCAFFLYGIGNNGKSTFVETIADMLGDYAANAQPDTIMMKKFSDNGAGSDIARLRSTRMVTTEEPTEGVRLNEGLLKQLTGGGKITCRFLYGDEFEYSPEFKLWMTTNHKPVIRGTDVGIWRRIRLIPFEVNIPSDKVDKQLKYKFREEMPQILRWAVEGAIAYRQEGLEPPACVKKSTDEYKAEMDMIATFMNACISIDYTADKPIPASDLYTVYTGWAKANNEYVMTSRKFFGELGKRTPEKKRTSTGVVYCKIKLTDFARRFVQTHYNASMFYGGDD